MIDACLLEWRSIEFSLNGEENGERAQLANWLAAHQNPSVFHSTQGSRTVVR